MENLDVMNESELLNMRDIFIALADYCVRKRHAMAARCLGDIEKALKLERELDHIYKQLPQWAKW